MFCLKYSSRFKKDLKYYKNNNTVLVELDRILNSLIKGDKLAAKNLNHSLRGEFEGCFECHIEPDLLLIYKIENREVLIVLLRIGSHSKLF